MPEEQFELELAVKSADLCRREMEALSAWGDGRRDGSNLAVIRQLVADMEAALESIHQKRVRTRWRIHAACLRIIEADLVLRESSRDGSRDWSADRDRLRFAMTQAAQCLADDPVAGSCLESLLADSSSMGMGGLIANALLTLPLPIVYTRKRESLRERFLRESGAKRAEQAERERPPVIRITADLDGQPLVAPSRVYAQRLYDLSFHVRGTTWPVTCDGLRLEFLTTCPRELFHISDFRMEKSPEGGDIAGELVGNISFPVAQSVLAGDLSFSVRAVLEGDSGKCVPVVLIGHNMMTFRVADPAKSALASGYPRLDCRVEDLLREALTADPRVNDELETLLPVLVSLSGILGTFAQEGVYKGRADVSEREFQREVLRLMRVRLGEGVQEHTNQAGGITDISYGGVVVELKVEDKDGNRVSIGQKYASQATQYQGVAARRISVVLVLDLTEKDRPPGDIRSDILLVDVPTHGAGSGPDGSKAFVFVVNGNVRSPSTYSQ